MRGGQCGVINVQTRFVKLVLIPNIFPNACPNLSEVITH